MVFDKRIWCGPFDDVLYHYRNDLALSSRSFARYCDKARLFHFPPGMRAPVYISCDVRPSLCRPDAELGAKLARMTNTLALPETLV
jgi:hypothetical protein